MNRTFHLTGMTKYEGEIALQMGFIKMLLMIQWCF